MSRGNFLWIVYPIATEKNQLRITVTAHEEGNPTMRVWMGWGGSGIHYSLKI